MNIPRAFLGLGNLGQSCTTLTPDSIYQYAVGAGFPCDVAAQMVAIAMKESGGNTCAHNPKPPDDSYGLWQINMCQAPNCLRGQNLLPARLAQFGLTSASNLFDPGANAAAAYQLWGGNDANLNIAWAINDGSLNQARYNMYLPNAQAIAAAAGCSALGTPDNTSVSDSTSPTSSTDTSSAASTAGFDPMSLFTNALAGDPGSMIVVGGTVVLVLWLAMRGR